MPDLDFRIESCAPVDHAAAPLLSFRLAVSNAAKGETIHSVALRAQIQLEVTRRTYSAQDQQRLLDLFGAPDRWSSTLRNMLWTNAGVTVPQFDGETSVELQAPCTFDFNVAATKYFYGLSDGDVPLCFLFSGSVFYSRGDGPPQIAPISWSKEARFRLPVSVWRRMMDSYYPNTAWLCLRRDVFDRVYQFKIRNGIPRWEEAFERMLAACEEEVAVP